MKSTRFLVKLKTHQSRVTCLVKPGSGFGAAGEGYFRLSAFNSRGNVQEAMQRVQMALAG